MISLIGNLFLVLQAIGASAMYLNTSITEAQSCDLTWAVIGDSWASGVTYSSQTSYDNNKDKCYRLNHAYGPQGEKDPAWVEGKNRLIFKACSGSQLVHMALDQKNSQMAQVGPDPRLVVMTAGGNNAGFFNVVDSCVYQSEAGNYGNRCSEAIKHARDYITRRQAQRDEHVLYVDLRNTILDILKYPAAQKPDFHLYVTGYAHFFNQDTDWCDNETFGVHKNRPLLKKALRRQINDLVEQVNNVYRNVINDLRSNKVQFVAISQKFQGHRFCEPGSDHRKQYYDNKVWFWNFSWAWSTSGNPAAPLPPVKPFHSSTPGSPEWDGSSLRPFHPKIDGHRVIKDAIIEQARRDKIRCVK